MTRKAIKVKELKVLESFLNDLGFSYKRIREDEAPDFWIESQNGEEVGVELTEYNINEEERKLESARQKFCENFQKLECPQFNGLNFYFAFKGPAPLQKNFKKFVSELDCLLKKESLIENPRESLPIILTVKHMQDYEYLSQYCSEITISYIGEQNSTFCSTEGFKWIGVKRQEILRIIDNKKYHTFNSNTEAWLVIHGNFHPISTAMGNLDLINFKKAIRNRLNDTSFDKVFIYSPPGILEWSEENRGSKLIRSN